MTRKLIVPLVLLVLIVALLVPKMAEHNAQVQAHRSADPVLLPTYGHYNYFTGCSENLLSLQLVSGQDALDPAKLQVSFPENGLLSATVLDCIPVRTHDGYALWTLNLRVNMSSSVQRCVVNQITIHDKTYDLGRLDIQSLPQSGPTGDAEAVELLSLRGHLGTSAGRGLQNYHASFRNDTADPMTLTEVSAPSYRGAPLELQVNSQPVASHLPLQLEPGDLVEVTMALRQWEGAKQTSSETYCVSPTLRYDHLGQGYTIPMFPCFFGFSMSQEEFVTLCGEYMGQENTEQMA